SATIIKLIPLVLMGVVGIIAGLINGITIENLSNMVDKTAAGGVYYAVPRTSFIDLKSLFPAVCATSFAYEGWIMATTINSELKDGKKNLPKALIVGTIGTMVIYILYYVGLAGAVSTPELMNNSASYAFTKLFGSVAGTILTVFIVISCLGTLNGIMMSCTRGMYSLAIRNEGLSPEVMKQVDKKTNMPTNSSVFGLLMTVVWFFYFYATQLQTDNKPWFGPIDFDPTELPIIATYLLYIPIFVLIIIKEKDLSFFKRFFTPVLSIAGSVVMIFACIKSHGTDNLWFLLVLGIIIFIGLLLPHGKKNEKATSK
ncbi:MAG: APC family permease, partial [Acutalibacteraceae bacterium]